MSALRNQRLAHIQTHRLAFSAQLDNNIAWNSSILSLVYGLSLTNGSDRTLTVLIILQRQSPVGEKQAGGERSLPQDYL